MPPKKPGTVIERTFQANDRQAPLVVQDDDIPYVPYNEDIRATPIRSKNNLYMKRQTFGKNTWFMDLVHFNYPDKFNGWFAFFVEANTRYLIPIPASIQPVGEGVQQDIGGRADSIVWKNILEKFKKLNFIREEREGAQNTRAFRGTPKPISLLIGDSEPSFWTHSSQAWYQKNRIATKKVNTSKEGHAMLSILDRVVRTIRDMIENYRFPGVLKRQSKLHAISLSVDGIIRVCHEYNNTPHSQLKGGFTKGKTKKRRIYWTPFEVHNDPIKEAIVVKKRIGQNWTVEHRVGYHIPLLWQ